MSGFGLGWLPARPRTGPANAIDIAIAITGFITESSMVSSWNSATVEQFAKPLFGLEAENQLVLTTRPECLRRVDLTIRIRTPSMSMCRRR